MTKSNSKEPVTRGMLDEAVQAILEGMDKIVGGLRNEMNIGFEKLNAKVDQTGSELRDEIDGLKADLSETPSRREFEEVKARLDEHHPLS
jgi:hypothetical protein